MNKAVRRFITCWRKGEDRPSGDLELAAIDLDALRGHFGLEAGNPMYEVFRLNDAALKFVRLRAKHEFDFDKFDYTLECCRIE